MSKPSIAFVASGRNHFIRTYLEYFHQKGYRVSLISYDVLGADRSPNYPVYNVSSGADARKYGTKWRYLLAGLRTRKILKEIKPDILHGHYATSAGVICLMSGFRPYIVSARGSDLIGSMNSRLWRMILGRVFEKSALVHTVSTQLSAKAKELNVPQDKLLTLTQGVDTDVFAFKPPAKTCQTPIKLICTRTIDEVYDPETIVRACRLLNDAGISFKLTFAAGGPLEKEVKDLARQAGLDGKIHFMGGYANHELPDMLQNHDLYLSASKWDGTSVSLLEAMAVGLFPIVSRIDSNNAWLEDGKTALMFDCGNAHQLAEAIRRATEDNDFRVSAIQSNRQLVIEKADRKMSMKMLEEVYYKILSLEQ